MTNEEVGNELERLDNESNEIKDSIINICWWMRGSISHTESWNLTEKERAMIQKLIKNNLDTMKKNKYQISLI